MSENNPKDVYSFMSASAVSPALLSQLQIAAGENLTGIYFNDPEHFVAFTDKAFYWVRRDREVICPYSSILHTKLPANDEDVSDEREIEVSLKNGDFLFLPIYNDTDGIEDIYCLAEMLEKLIDANTNIQALEDMIDRLILAVEDFKLKPQNWKTPLPVPYFEAIIEYLKDSLESCRKGEAVLNTAPDQFISINQPRTWQLIAEILLAPRNFDR